MLGLFTDPISQTGSLSINLSISRVCGVAVAVRAHRSDSWDAANHIVEVLVRRSIQQVKESSCYFWYTVNDMYECVGVITTLPEGSPCPDQMGFIDCNESHHPLSK